jgi:starch-binding outer membrane protein, SusD/RagB family
MKKNNQTILRGLFIVALTVISGCSDFLDKPLQGQLTQENFPTSGSDALLATNAVYNTLRINLYHQGLFPILDIMSDDGHKGSNPDDAAATVGPYDNFTHIPTEGNLSRWWNTLYEGVKRANVVINLVPSIGMDEALRNRYVAEAKFLRALFYFDLVRAWGKVPIVTTVVPALGLKRSAVEDVYALIEEDLFAAIESLHLNTTQRISDGLQKVRPALFWQKSTCSREIIPTPRSMRLK